MLLISAVRYIGYLAEIESMFVFHFTRRSMIKAELGYDVGLILEYEIRGETAAPIDFAVF